MAIKITGPIGAGGGGATSLGGLSDVTLSSVQTNQILSYDGAQWVNQTGITGGLTYKGSFDASAGTPSLANALQGDFYIIGTAGTIYGQTWAVGDHLVINEDMGGTITNSKIDKIDNTDLVTSVNGRTGAVTGLLENVVEDTTPQLGGNLDVNGQSIVSASAGNIAITPDTTGSIVLDGLSWPQADGSADQVLKTNGAGQLSFVDQTSGLSAVVDDTTPQLGGALDVNGQAIVSASAGNIAITPDTTGSIVLDGQSWPQADGTTGQVLSTNGAGQLSWTAPTSGLQDVVDDTTPQLGGDLDVNGQSIVSVSAGNIAITPDTTGSIVLDGLNWPQADGTTGQVLKTDGAGNLGWVTAAGGLSAVVDDTTPQLGGALDVNGQSIVSVSAGDIAITPDTTGSIVLDGLNWPQADGTTGQVLKTDGAGNLGWVTAAGGLSAVVDDTTPQLGGALDVNGQSIVSASAGNIAITPDTTGSIVLDGQNWPQADGTTGQVLQTNGAGQLSWTTPTTGLQDVVDDTTPQLGGNLDVNGQSIVSASAGNIAITPDTTGSIVLDGQSWPQADGTTGQVLSTNGAGQLSWTAPTSGLSAVVDDTTPQLGGALDVNGQAIVSASAGNIAITPDTTGSIVLDGQSWPQADGTTGQYLSTNGSGQLSWVTAAGASRPTVTTDNSGTNSTISNPSAGTLEDIYLVDNGASAVTITLPTVTSNSGYKVQIKRLGTANVTLSPASGTIDGAGSKILTLQYMSLTLTTDGTNWFII
jgi:hypothetical protein